MTTATAAKPVSLERHYKTPLPQKPSFFTRANTVAPKTRIPRGRENVYEWSYAHSIYVIHCGKHYPELRLNAKEAGLLKSFIGRMDERLKAKTRLTSGFDGPVARIVKVLPSNPDYTRGMRWRYSMGRGPTFRMPAFTTLDLLMFDMAKHF